MELRHNSLFQICFYFNFKIAIIGQDGYQINAKNHYENYLGNEHLDKTKMVSANKRINKLLDAVHYYSQEYDIKIYNLSKISKFKQFPKYIRELSRKYLMLIPNKFKMINKKIKSRNIIYLLVELWNKIHGKRKIKLFILLELL